MPARGNSRYSLPMRVFLDITLCGRSKSKANPMRSECTYIITLVHNCLSSLVKPGFTSFYLQREWSGPMGGWFYCCGKVLFIYCSFHFIVFNFPLTLFFYFYCSSSFLFSPRPSPLSDELCTGCYFVFLIEEKLRTIAQGSLK